MKKNIVFPVILLAFLMITLIVPVDQSAAEGSVTSEEIDQAVEKTVNFYREQGAPSDEWVVFALNAVGEDVNKVPYVSDGKTFLDNYTLPDNPTINDYSKAIIALTSAGQDVKNYNGRNLIEELTSCIPDDISSINTAAYALIALDAAGAEVPVGANITRDKLVNYLLDKQVENTWGYYWGGDYYPDIDTTGQAITALAPYYDNPDYPNVKSKVDNAFNWLETQLPFTNSCSLSWVIQALTALGEDPEIWAAGNNLVEDFLAYQLSDGTFEWQSGEGPDLLFSTPQGLQALAALRDFEKNGKSTIYKDIQYNEKNIITLRIEGAQTDGTVLAKTIMDVPKNSSLDEIVQLAVERYDLSVFISVYNGNIVPGHELTVPEENQFYCVIDDSYINIEENPTVTDNADITLFLGDADTQLARLSITGNSIDNANNVISTHDYVYVKVEELNKANKKWEGSVGAFVYLGDEFVGTTDNQGDISINPDRTGDLQIYAQKFEADGTPIIVKTHPQKITVRDSKIEQVDPVSSFPLDSDADVTVKIINYLTDQSREGLLIVALYDTDNNKMINYSYVTKEIAPGSSETFTAGFAIPASGNYEVRAFMWDNWNNRTPLTDTIIIPVKD